MSQPCPKCGAELSATEVAPGVKVVCASCKSLFIRVEDDGSLIIPPSEKGCMTCALISLGLLVLLLIGIAAMWPRIGRSIEHGFSKVLVVQGLGQDHYRESQLRDDDKDAIGEYVFIADMPVLEEQASAPTDAPARAIPARLKEHVARDHGVVNLGAYALLFYLPNADGTWQRDSGISPPLDAASADARESAFIIYAVPRKPGWLGTRVMVTDQGRRGDDGAINRAIFFAENRVGIDGKSHLYDATTFPMADAAYTSPAAAREAPLGADAEHKGTDGMIWKRLTLEQ